jgi:hypothetical protein
MTADLVRVPFRGGDLVAVAINGEPHVSVRHVCDALGIDLPTQLRKLNSRSWATVVKMPMVAADGKRREVAVIDRRTLTMWLATIGTNAVAIEARELLDAYQAEAADALDAYFNRGGVAVRPGDLSPLDAIRAMVDQIEVAQRQAGEAKVIATETAARLDAIEGRHDWFAALGYAKLSGLKDTSSATMSRLGRTASRIARERGIEPVQVPHALYGRVNSLPRWAWDAAAEEISGPSTSA